MTCSISLKFVSLVAGLMLVFTAYFSVAATGHETPPVLEARDWIAEGKLTGPDYEIDTTAPTDGFLMTFTMHSKFGTFRPRSPGRLENFLVEIAALRQLEEVSTSDVFVNGLENSAKEFGQEAKDLVTKPVKTLEGLPIGVEHFFERTYRATRTGSQRLGDLTDSSNAEFHQAGPGAKLPGGTGQNISNSKKPDVVIASAAMAGNVALNILGYNDQRLALAKTLNVNPYTSNKVLADKLDDVAWAAFSGGLGITALKIAMPASMAVTVGSKSSAWVWDTPPGDLKVFIQDTLLAMKVDQELVDHFLRYRWYTLSLRVRLARALDQVKVQSGHTAVLNLALTVESEDQARFVVEALEMLAAHQGGGTPLTQIEVLGTVIGRTQNGEIVLPAPLDYVSWSRRLDHFARWDGLVASKRSILLRGILTPRAKEELVSLGWQVHENVSAMAQ